MINLKHKKFYVLLILIFMLMISPFHRIINYPKKILSHLNTIIFTTLENRKNTQYAYMGYEFINKLTKNISNRELAPLIIYKNWGYGVTSLLSGLRLKINKNIILVVGLDKKMPNIRGNSIKCEDDVKNQKSFVISKTCLFKGPVYITGISLDRKLEKNEIISITFITKKNKLKKFNVNDNDLKYSSKLSSFKIPKDDSKLFDIIKHNNLENGHLKVVLESQKKINFSLTGFSKNSEPKYEINDHYIIAWDNKDARNYMGINKSIITKNFNIKDQNTCKMLSEMLETISNYDNFEINNDC